MIDKNFELENGLDIEIEYPLKKEPYESTFLYSCGFNLCNRSLTAILRNHPSMNYCLFCGKKIKKDK